MQKVWECWTRRSGGCDTGRKDKPANNEGEDSHRNNLKEINNVEGPIEKFT